MNYTSDIKDIKRELKKEISFETSEIDDERMLMSRALTHYYQAKNNQARPNDLPEVKRVERVLKDLRLPSVPQYPSVH